MWERLVSEIEDYVEPAGSNIRIDIYKKQYFEDSEMITRARKALSASYLMT